MRTPEPWPQEVLFFMIKPINIRDNIRYSDLNSNMIKDNNYNIATITLLQFKYSQVTTSNRTT